jgi:hypothetical protein
MNEVVKSPVRLNLKFVFLAVNSEMDRSLGLGQGFRPVRFEDMGFYSFKRIKCIQALGA